MALPLLWLGVAALSSLTMKELNDDRKSKQNARKFFNKVQTLSCIEEHEATIAIYPSDFLDSKQTVHPQVGAIVSCGIGGVLDHTGIWIGDDTIVELSGSGLVKAISSKRFLHGRSGKKIFIACDSIGTPLVNLNAAYSASQQIFQYKKYDIVNNNCHEFIWQCFQQDSQPITTFKTLNNCLAQYFDRVIYWDICHCKDA